MLIGIVVPGKRLGFLKKLLEEGICGDSSVSSKLSLLSEVTSLLSRIGARGGGINGLDGPFVVVVCSR